MPEVYDIYHDESKEGGYWHGFLFVPRCARADLLDLLVEARRNTGYWNEVHYVKIKASTEGHHEKAIITWAWTTIGCSALQQRKLRTFPPKVFLGFNPKLRDRSKYKALDRLLKCTFVLFRERDDHTKMFGGLDQLQRIETTFRMGLKGGIHKLFSDNDPITIGNVFIDGDEHYFKQFRRTLGVDGTLMRLADEKRSYVSFLGAPRLTPQRSDHQKIEANQDPDDSHLLQLCDVLIGGFRFHSYCPNPRHIRYEISLACRELLAHEQRNYARMRQSRFLNGFSLEEAWLDDGEWYFSPLAPKVVRTCVGTQLPLMRS
jgi:hypothetical protein